LPSAQLSETSGADDLAGFKNALLAQHRERYLALKRSVDEDLADMITARRLQVERIVHDLRRSCEKLLDEGLKANRRRVELQKKAYKVELQDDVFEHLEKRVRARLEAFRRSPGYGDAMETLVAEARDVFPFPSIAWVEKGDSAFLKPSGNVLEVREELQNAWGGLVLVEAKESESIWREGARLVDNTFRTRWRRLCPSFAAGLGDVFTGFFE
jgi:hypothetical protein